MHVEAVGQLVAPVNEYEVVVFLKEQGGFAAVDFFLMNCPPKIMIIRTAVRLLILHCVLVSFAASLVDLDVGPVVPMVDAVDDVDDAAVLSADYYEWETFAASFVYLLDVNVDAAALTEEVAYWTVMVDLEKIALLLLY